ncbi:MAG TPA: hypothetical protein VEL28_17430 [Candidatus Binatia bacterium]|nr:hypothetical protein [Candidatus Binatia bacterium]
MVPHSQFSRCGDDITTEQIGEECDDGNGRWAMDARASTAVSTSAAGTRTLTSS